MQSLYCEFQLPLIFFLKDFSTIIWIGILRSSLCWERFIICLGIFVIIVFNLSILVIPLQSALEFLPKSLDHYNQISNVDNDRFFENQARQMVCCYVSILLLNHFNITIPLLLLRGNLTFLPISTAIFFVLLFIER